MKISRKAVVFWILFVILCFLVSYIYFTVKLISDNKLQSATDKNLIGSISNAVQKVEAKDNIENSIQPIDASLLNAKSAISVGSNLSFNDKIIFEKNSNEKLPVASLTKLMTALVVTENVDLSQQIKISEEAVGNIESVKTFMPGQVFIAKDLLSAMLISSNNTAAFALAEAIGNEKFIALMNKKAVDLGLKNTSFVDPAGLSPENISTARDLTRLAEYILKEYPEIAKITKSKDYFVPGYGSVSNTNQLLYEMPNIVFSKTGFTNEAEGCLLLAVGSAKENNYLVSVILGSNNRFFEMKKIINLSI
jgi:D-alanyl-D-alanine carboxypeptidase (penicillin-binding protein 5/6)